MISQKYAMRHSASASWTFLPAPDQNVDRTPTRVGDTRTALGGQTTVQTIATAAGAPAWFRTFVLPFVLLSPTEWAIIDGFRTLAGPHFYTDNAGTTSYTVSVVSLAETSVVNGYRNGTLTLQQVGT